jgi:hypothetical protein
MFRVLGFKLIVPILPQGGDGFQLPAVDLGGDKIRFDL